MSVFTAYVALVLRWCGESEAVFRHQTDGRSPGLENAIGFFAAVLHLRIELRDSDTFIDLLNRITQEQCSAHEHADSCYIDSRVPRYEFVLNGRFNWIPEGSGISSSRLDESEDSITCSPIRFQHPALKKLESDREPGVLLYDRDDEVSGGVLFPLNRFSTDMMEGFARNFMLFIGALSREPELRVKSLALR